VSRRVSGKGGAARASSSLWRSIPVSNWIEYGAANTNTKILKDGSFWEHFNGFSSHARVVGNGSIQGQIVPIPRLSPAVVTGPELALWEHFLEPQSMSMGPFSCS